MSDEHWTLKLAELAKGSPGFWSWFSLGLAVICAGILGVHRWDPEMLKPIPAAPAWAVIGLVAGIVGAVWFLPLHLKKSKHTSPQLDPVSYSKWFKQARQKTEVVLAARDADRVEPLNMDRVAGVKKPKLAERKQTQSENAADLTLLEQAKREMIEAIKHRSQPLAPFASRDPVVAKMIASHLEGLKRRFETLSSGARLYLRHIKMQKFRTIEASPHDPAIQELIRNEFIFELTPPLAEGSSTTYIVPDVVQDFLSSIPPDFTVKGAAPWGDKASGVSRKTTPDPLPYPSYRLSGGEVLRLKARLARLSPRACQYLHYIKVRELTDIAVARFDETIEELLREGFLVKAVAPGLLRQSYLVTAETREAIKALPPDFLPVSGRPPWGDSE